MRRGLALMLALALLVMGGSALAEAQRFEGPGYESPEAAVEAYVEALNAGDLWGMLSTFAVETVADRADPRAATARTHTWMYTGTGMAPVFDGYTRDLAVAMRLNALVGVLYQGMLTRAWPADFGAFDGAPVPFNGDDMEQDIDRFFAGFGASDFAGWKGQVTLERFVTPEDLGVAETYANENNQANIQRVAAALGCDALEDRAAMLRAAGKTYVQFMQCACYGDVWYNYTPLGNLAILCGLDTLSAGLASLDEP